MSKNLYFLISFVLVLSLSGFAQADAIDVNNFSFELDSDGNQNTCGTGTGETLAWEVGGSGFVGTNIDCCSPVIDVGCLDAEDCWDVNSRLTGGQMPDGYSHLYFQVGAYIYQILDMNNSDANAVIQAGRKYTLKWDGLGWNDSITATLFYGNDPDANEIASTTQSLVQSGETPWYYFPGELTFVAEPSQDYLGETLGLKFTPGGDGYVFIDNVRLEWSWASTAYDPDPADEAEDVPMDVNLAWSPGLWAVGDVNGHEVYFGTSYTEVYDATTATAGIYRGSGVGIVSGPDVNNRYSYNALETLELGKTYYWRIDEVNEGWVSGPVPPVNDRWKGEVWSFTVTGFAYNVYPPDGGTDIPALNLLLRWEAGTGAGGHDVYFGSDEAAVESADTSTVGIYRGPTQALADVNCAVEDLDVSKTYFWRVDEVNTTTGTFVEGDVWSFTTGVFLIVDSFEFYEDTTAVKAVWKDKWSGIITKNLAETFLEFADANKFLATGEQSMEFYYRNYEMSGGSPVGCTAIADLPLEVGPDWTAGGVKALMVNFCGDTANGQDADAKYTIDNDRMWISLEDGVGSEGIKRYPTMGHVTDGDWHTWNVSLLDPCFSSVDMNNVVKVYIGFGGVKGGATSKYGAGYTDAIGDTVWFDDIRLYPPRCMPAMTGLDVLHSLGDITGPGEEGALDCNTNYLDLAVLASDWNMRGGWYSPSPPTAIPVVEYKFEEGGTGTNVTNTGSLGSGHNLTIGMGVDVNHTPVADVNNAPIWVSDADPCRGWTLWFDGRDGSYGSPDTSDPCTTGGGDYLIGPALNLNSNTVTLAAWLKPDPWCMGTDKKTGQCNLWEQSGGFTGLIHTRDANSTGGMSYNFTGGYTYNGELGYEWNGEGGTWKYHSDILIPDFRWSLVAVVIKPDQANLYVADFNTPGDANDDKLYSATHMYTQEPDEWDGLFTIAADGGIIDGKRGDRFFRGQMDDVRVYNEALGPGEILGLAGMEGVVYVPCTSPADMVVGNKEPNYPEVDDQVDFVDYSALAKNWLEQHTWP
ncbi:MAG: LamG domain-containing protein [Planctomycetota bacterium]|jgi:hypothetical protein